MEKFTASARRSVLETWLLLFYAFSAAGWVWEVLFTAAATGKWVNRGLLHGPWLPIYGIGGVILALILARPELSGGRVLFIGALTGGAAEYCTAWLLEVLYRRRWWDYTGCPGNIHGRVCLASIAGFAAAGWLISRAAPVLLGKIGGVEQSARSAVCRSVSLLFAADWSVSLLQPNTGAGITFPF